jgi:pimeloyl-ACP methyl ester carboxylesterase
MTTAVQPWEHTLDARGLRFHYVEWGDPDAPAVVLLHGLSAMCRIWDHLALTLHDRYHLIALDQRGHGDTSWPKEPAYGTDDYVADLEALVDAWGLGRFALVGLSMGGFNAMAYSARHLERVSCLAIVDIRPAIDPERRPNRDQDRRTAEQGHPPLPSLEAAFMARKLGHPLTPEASLRHHVRHQLRQAEDGRWTYKQDPRASYYWRAGDLRPALANIPVPVLIVRGGESQVLPADIAESMRAAFPNAELVTIVGAGHTVPEDRPAEFNAAVSAFLDRHRVAG